MLNRATFLVLLLTASSGEMALACSFCSPVTGSTMLTDLDASDVAFVAELDVPTPPPSNPTVLDLLNRERQKGEATFRVRSVLKGELDAEQSEAIVVPLRIPDTRGTLHLITHDRSEDRWRSYRLSDDGLKFASGAAALPILAPKEAPSRRIVQRLEYCLRFLGTDDFQLRRAMFAEFYRAPYSSLQQLKPRLDRKQVHRWMQSASKRAEEARLIFMLLSICGDETDVQMLKEEFERCVQSNWAGTLDGVILAYVSLGGVDALEEVDERLLAPTDLSIELKEAGANALRFLIDHKTNIARPRLLLSCRQLLTQPKTADLILQDLARWENWQWNSKTAK